VWWRKPYGGLDGHGIAPKGRYEGSPESSEVSSLGKLSVFSKSPIGALGIPVIMEIRMLTHVVHLDDGIHLLFIVSSGERKQRRLEIDY
jgi:hypothetical protein